ncbi:DGQHR domain-containing protein [Vibrio cyclitrophicus]|uniref:DGQHR domain-containing protein n=1 Tax=Vibrio sp. 10N.261.51.A4 TaxID=3229674 RepID=UPI00354DE2DA
MNVINSKYLKLTQPIGEFYCCVMKASELTSISFSDVRKLKDENEDGIDSYLGIQRKLSPPRVKKIKEYITSVDATFPNSIIVAIPEKYISTKDGVLSITFSEEYRGKVAKVLDGQHRLAGFEDTDGKYENKKGNRKDFELLVTIFVEADLHTQSQVFTMVNQSQTKVNKSLVYDLEALALARSPFRSCHQIAIVMNERDDSPFYRRIKRLGIKTKGVDGELLTQAAFVDNLVKLISKKPSLDRDILLGKKKGFLGLKDDKLPDRKRNDFKVLVFRKSFIEKDDAAIAANVINYFSAVNERWPDAWDKKNKKSVLNKTVGLISLMRMLRLIVNKLVDDGEVEYGDVIKKDEYIKVLNKVKVECEYFTNVDAVSRNAGLMYKEMTKYIK